MTKDTYKVYHVIRHLMLAVTFLYEYKFSILTYYLLPCNVNRISTLQCSTNFQHHCHQEWSSYNKALPILPALFFHRHFSCTYVHSFHALFCISSLTWSLLSFAPPPKFSYSLFTTLICILILMP